MQRLICAVTIASISLIAYADDITSSTANSGNSTSTSAVPLTPTTTNLPQDSTVVPPGSTTVPPHTPTTIITPPATQSAPQSSPPSVPGGYSDAKINDPEVQKAAAFAVQQMNNGPLVKILSAQTQVVAGKNINLQLVILQNGVNYQYNVTVFIPLPSANQPMQLTNVAAMGNYDETSSTDSSADNSNAIESGPTE